MRHTIEPSFIGGQRIPFPIHLGLRLLITLLPLAAASGCCCASFWYDAEAYQTWAELERSLNEGPPPPTKFAGAKQTIEEQTGVTLRLPLLFRYSGPKAMNTLVPGTKSDDKAVSQGRLYPYLVAEDEGVIVEFPGLRTTYEAHYGQKTPVYCYLAVWPKEKDARDEAKRQVLSAVQAAFPEAAWETKQLGETDAAGAAGLTADYLEATGEQGFERPAPFKPAQLPGKLAIYVVEKDYAYVLVGYRGPTDIAERVDLFKAGEAAIATIKSEKPAQPIKMETGGSVAEPPSGEHVQAGSTPVELIPPSGYHASSRINGFQKEGSNTQITVQVRNDPYSAAINTYTDERLRTSNFAATSREQVTVDENPATLLLLRGPQGTQWKLIFGDQRRSFEVTGKLADPEADREEVRDALLTARVRD